MRAVASRGLFGATVGSLSYLFYKQAELQELIRDEGDRFLRNFQLEATGPHGSNGLKQTAFDSCMRQYGACVLLQALPLHSHAMQKPKEGHLAEVLEGITFQGRPLLGPSKRINLDVAGAAIGSALAMPLLFPGSFLAGALVGHSSGYILSMLQSMKQPSVKALLETACSRFVRQMSNLMCAADAFGLLSFGFALPLKFGRLSKRGRQFLAIFLVMYPSTPSEPSEIHIEIVVKLKL